MNLTIPMKTSKNIVTLALAGTMSLSLMSCATNEGTGTLVGAGSGAALGGIIGNNVGSGHTGTGMALGALAGGLVGNRVGAAQDTANVARAESERANTATVYVRNRNGSTSPVTLRRVQGNVWQGPRGEQYNGVPSSRQLESIYAY